MRLALKPALRFALSTDTLATLAYLAVCSGVLAPLVSSSALAARPVAPAWYSGLPVALAESMDSPDSAYPDLSAQVAASVSLFLAVFLPLEVFLLLVVSHPMEADKFLGVFLPVDDKAACLPVDTGDANRPVAVSAALVADNTVVDILDEIPDNIRPTSTDSRNMDCSRNKPLGPPNSFASRSSPSRNRNC
jgi:hypothetical protein